MMMTFLAATSLSLAGVLFLRLFLTREQKLITPSGFQPVSTPGKLAGQQPDLFDAGKVYLVNESYTTGYIAAGSRVRVVDMAGKWLVCESLENQSRALLTTDQVTPE